MPSRCRGQHPLEVPWEERLDGDALKLAEAKRIDYAVPVLVPPHQFGLCLVLEPVLRGDIDACLLSDILGIDIRCHFVEREPFEMIPASGRYGKREGHPFCAPRIDRGVVHAFTMNDPIAAPYLQGSAVCPFGQDSTDTLTGCYFFDQLYHGTVVAEVEIQTVQLCTGQNSSLITFHGPG